MGYAELLRQRFVLSTNRGLNNSSYPTELNSIIVLLSICIYISDLG